MNGQSRPLAFLYYWTNLLACRWWSGGVPRFKHNFKLYLTANSTGRWTALEMEQPGELPKHGETISGVKLSVTDLNNCRLLWRWISFSCSETLSYKYRHLGTAPLHVSFPCTKLFTRSDSHLYLQLLFRAAAYFSLNRKEALVRQG